MIKKSSMMRPNTMILIQVEGRKTKADVQVDSMPALS
jgi:hypothetical protein